MNILKFLAFSVAAAAFSSGAQATVIQTVGAGTAVTNVEATADFENQSALFANPYVEGGMSFSRTGLTFNNNGCGYAGCSGSFPGFSGNYMYGTGSGGYFDMVSLSGLFTGLEFNAHWSSGAMPFIWETYRVGVLTGSGTGTVAPGSVLGFADASGFDRLKWTSTYSGLPAASFTSTANAPAFDNVKAQFSSNDIPEPGTLALLGMGLIGFAFARRKSAAR
jgi:hypothetical protein